MGAQLYHNGTIITVDSARRIILDGAILVIDGRIAAVGKTDELQASSKIPDDAHRVDLRQRIAMPGLINGHVHLIQSVMRGLAENLELHAWASCAIWPLESAFRDGDGEAAARLTVAEMLKSGTTCFLEPMLPSSPDNPFSGIVKAIGESGIRACVGKLVKIRRSDPSAGIPDSRDSQGEMMSVEKALDAHGEFHGTYNDRMHIWMAPETPRGQDEKGFKAVGTACAENNIRLTIHCSEAAKDLEMIREHYKATPAEFLRNVNSTGPHVVLGHMVHLDEKDFAILRDTQTSVAHNPTSNAKLADGIAPIPRMLQEGINVCIGSDGAPCNNRHDLFRDMHLAGIIHKAKLQDATALSAEQILEMTTINAAKALGIDHEVGSLEVGKKADIVVLDHTGLHCAPYDPLTLGQGGQPATTIVVHSMSGRDVDMVIVDGEVLVDGGKFTRMDEEKIKADAREAIARIRKDSSVNAQPLTRGWQYV
ncbi:5-methylthioadenosine/S-adenosylhomocysteine deaminase n1 [Thozetella sp. PMI_491]|nr:5-methylthioadenosine/S-adenosylhomocysteine deaminase n1 [Thozetella sp. PMI_491]